MKDLTLPDRQLFESALLTRPIGSIPTDEELIEGLLEIPRPPPALLEPHLWPYSARALDALYVPDSESVAVSRSIDLILRGSMQMKLKGTGTGLDAGRIMFVVGLSGSGKSAVYGRSLMRYPKLVIHDELPGFHGQVTCLIWIRVSVPASGTLWDLADRLITETAKILKDPSLIDRLKRGRRRGKDLFAGWADFARGHFLALLHLDECQNFFSLKSLEHREKGQAELKIADDHCLKELLIFSDSGVALCLSGTPDSQEILGKRFSIQQRIISGGHHIISRFADEKDKRFTEQLLPKFLKFQYGGVPITDVGDLAHSIYTGSAGIRRLIRVQWQSAVRIAANLQKPLSITHFETAKNTYMKPLQSILAGIIAKDPAALKRYEDLCRRGEVELNF